MTTLQPFLNTHKDAAFRFLGLPTQVRATGDATGGTFGLIEHWEMPVGFATPYHTHRREDESFYIIDGELAFLVDGKWSHAGAGAFVFGPRNVAHGFRVVGDAPARVLMAATPAGFEQFVLAQTTPIDAPPSPPDMGRLMQLAAEYEIEIHGPLPEE